MIKEILKGQDVREQLLSERMFTSGKTITYDFSDWVSGKKPMLLVVGHMGSGKSTIGKALAKKYKAKYVELDRCLNGKAVMAAETDEEEEAVQAEYDKCVKRNLIQHSKGDKSILEGLEIVNIYVQNDPKIVDKGVQKLIIQSPMVVADISAIKAGLRVSQRVGKSKKASKFIKFLAGAYGIVGNLSFNFAIERIKKDRKKQPGTKVEFLDL